MSKQKAVNDDLIDLLVKDKWYDIRSDGTIWTCRPPSGPKGTKKYPWRRVDRLRKNKDGSIDGRYIITYTSDHDPDNRGFLQVSRVIYRNFNGPLDPELEINHIDGNWKNNIPSNLELITKHENHEHARINKLQPQGQKFTKYPLGVLIRIKHLYMQGFTPYSISNTVKIHKSTVETVLGLYDNNAYKWVKVFILTPVN